VVEAAFGQAVDGKNIDTFRKMILVSIAKFVEECWTWCGISPPARTSIKHEM
jgi:hypothetical protein